LVALREKTPQAFSCLAALGFLVAVRCLVVSFFFEEVIDLCDYIIVDQLLQNADLDGPWAHMLVLLSNV
jgi:hypothetical protein